MLDDPVWTAPAAGVMSLHENLRHLMTNAKSGPTCFPHQSIYERVRRTSGAGNVKVNGHDNACLARHHEYSDPDKNNSR